MAVSGRPNRVHPREPIPPREKALPAPSAAPQGLLTLTGCGQARLPTDIPGYGASWERGRPARIDRRRPHRPVCGRDTSVPRTPCPYTQPRGVKSDERPLEPTPEPGNNAVRVGVKNISTSDLHPLYQYVTNSARASRPTGDGPERRGRFQREARLKGREPGSSEEDRGPGGPGEWRRGNRFERSGKAAKRWTSPARAAGARTSPSVGPWGGSEAREQRNGRVFRPAPRGGPRRRRTRTGAVEEGSAPLAARDRRGTRIRGG